MTTAPARTVLSRADILSVMQDTFARRYGAGVARLSDADLAAAQALVDTKFATTEWLQRVP